MAGSFFYAVRTAAAKWACVFGATGFFFKKFSVNFRKSVYNFRFIG